MRKTRLLSALMLMSFVGCIRQDGDVKCIQVDVKAAREVAVDEVSQKRIVLEATDQSLIDDLKALFVYDSLYIVYTNDRLLRFSSDGTFLGAIGAQGRSGKEYIGIWSAWQTEDGVSMYDMNGKKLMSFATDGRLLASIPLTTSASDNPFQKICPLTKRTNVGMTMYRGEEGFELALYDDRYAFVKYLGDLKLNDGLSLGYPFSRYGELVLYWRFLDYDIFSINNEGTVSQRYAIQFGPNSIPASKSFSDNYDKISYLNSHKDLAGMIADVKETDAYVVFTYLYDGGKIGCLYDKRKKTTKSFRFVHGNDADAVFLNIWLPDDHHLLTAFEENGAVVLYEMELTS